MDNPNDGFKGIDPQMLLTIENCYWQVNNQVNEMQLRIKEERRLLAQLEDDVKTEQVERDRIYNWLESLGWWGSAERQRIA